LLKQLKDRIMMKERISETKAYPSKYVEIDGSRVHYVEAGSGNPILFLHGVPTSSYVWRNIMPHLSTLGRCIAPDLMGFGKSDKPDIDYTMTDHIRYIGKFIQALNLKKITFVMHGSGSIIGFDYAMSHEDNCLGLVFYEAFLRSLNNQEMSLPLQEQLRNLQDQYDLSDVSQIGSSYVDTLIQQSVMRQLTNTEMEHYREPFLCEGTGKPILQYLKELPTGDGKNAVDKMIAAYTTKLTQSTLPKLMLYSVPGFITTIAAAVWAKEHLPHLEVVEIGEELHLGQETYPEVIGDTISVWLQGIELSRK